MGLLSNLKPFYVYSLMDGNNLGIFYIGKGQDDRVFQHVKEVKRGIAETAKQNKIAELESSGNYVKQTVIGRFDSEEEAYAVECILIHWVYGFDNLTNITSGHGVKSVRPHNNFGYIPGLEEDFQKPFYVYILTDPKTNQVFYVGKGKGKRYSQHQKEVESGIVETIKQKKIEHIISQGQQVKSFIVGRFKTEQEALAVESLLIHWVYGIDSLTNDIGGHGVNFIRPKGHYEELQGIDEPELNYCVRTKENRERNDIIPYLTEIRMLIESSCNIKFDDIHTHNDRHTYLVKFIKGVRLTVACHHSARKAAAVTIESLNGKKANKERVRYICDNSRLEWKDNGRYGRIMPAGTHSDPMIILEKFKETLAEIEKVRI
ncbi:LEM-3-like GIY-YIG domain-containing protein [Thiovibrio sp. JS02]